MKSVNAIEDESQRSLPHDSWDRQRCSAEFSALEDELKRPQVDLRSLLVRAQTLDLTLTRLAQDGSAQEATDEQIRAFQSKAQAVREALIVGEIPALTNDDEAWLKIVRTFRTRLLSQATVQELKQSLTQYTATVSATEQEVEHLERKVQRDRKAVELLERYLELLTAMSGSSHTRGEGK